MKRLLKIALAVILVQVSCSAALAAGENSRKGSARNPDFCVMDMTLELWMYFTSPPKPESDILVLNLLGDHMEARQSLMHHSYVMLGLPVFPDSLDALTGALAELNSLRGRDHITVAVSFADHMRRTDEQLYSDFRAAAHAACVKAAELNGDKTFLRFVFVHEGELLFGDDARAVPPETAKAP